MPIQLALLVVLCVILLLLLLQTFIVILCMGKARRYKRNQKALLLHIDNKLDALLKNAKIEYNPYGGDIPPKVIEAIHSGNKITAIKLYKEATGLGLKEAKEYIDTVESLTVKNAEW